MVAVASSEGRYWLLPSVCKPVMTIWVKPPFSGPAVGGCGMPWIPILRGNPRLSGDRPEARGVQVSKAGTRLVYDVGAEYVRIRRHHLSRFCGLDALLESSAIGDALKRSRNELRIVRVAKAPEDLVCVVWVEVFARIELIGMLEQGRAGLIDVEYRRARIRLGIKIQKLHGILIDAAGRKHVEVGAGS